MKSISLEALAKRIGVGVATVDRVLNERGGVSPETTRRVLEAAREAGLKRILPEERRLPWQIEVFLSDNDSRFFSRLTQDFADVADSLGYRRLTLHRTLVAESAPEKLAKSLIRSSKKRHAIIVFGNEHQRVYDALRQCREANVPVITRSPRRAEALPRRDRSAAGRPHRGHDDGVNGAPSWRSADAQRAPGLQRSSLTDSGISRGD